MLVRELLASIRSAVDSDVWQANATKQDATISCIGGILIVHAPESTNDKLANFLEDLDHQLSLQN